jgi:pimeloyl-ACP methyl ester carboxylesterase
MEKEADLLHALLGHWGIEKAILFGHSDGGSISLITAAKYSEKILGLITEGAHIFVEDLTVKGIREAIDLYKTTDLKKKLEKYHGNKTDAMFWAWAETWTNAMFRIWNIEHFLPSIKCPALIIQGEDDEYGTLRQVERIVLPMKGLAKSLVVPNIKHTPHKEAPELILEEAHAFIEKTLQG